MPDLAPPAAITAARLQLFAPRCDYMVLAPKLDAAAKANAITTARRVRHWVAQLHHESAGFTILEECLSYSAERLHIVWPSRFPTLASAEPYARNPRALAEKVYGGRGGNSRPGDGWNYRGGGLIQLTFHDGYAAASAYCGLDLVASPDLARQPGPACAIAAAWWAHHGLNQVVDADPDETVVADLHARIKANEDDDVRQARRVINGATLGLADVMAQLQRAATIWLDAPAAPVTQPAPRTLADADWRGLI
ncbi:MAG TPA: hypothetical protein VL358_04500 [Caulobacteraceae bacterium]|jgi:putative chitinase|nr:hypothetical protein [Caulobacteraceae bacterium]